MKRLKWLPAAVSFIAFMLIHSVWAEDGGGDGADDIDYDGDDHDDGDSHHHHADHGYSHSHNHLMPGIGGYYNPGFRGSYYGSVLRVPDGYRSLWIWLCRSFLQTLLYLPVRCCNSFATACLHTAAGSKTRPVENRLLVLLPGNERILSVC